MNTDIRILTNFKGHRKRKRLKLILGEDGTGYLIDLWLTVATDAPSGKLLGWDEVDIAIASGWEEDPQKYVKALLNLGFLDQDEAGAYSVHDWEINNGYAAHAAERSERARKAAAEKWGDADSRQERGKRTRAERMKAARSKGNHSEDEWAEMKEFFGTCVKCGGSSNLSHMDRDHILPVYQDGCHSIRNIQPLCAKCNAGKGPESKDYRIEFCRINGIEMPAKWVKGSCTNVDCCMHDACVTQASNQMTHAMTPAMTPGPTPSPSPSPSPTPTPKRVKIASALKPLPKDFEISGRVRVWAEKKGHGKLDEHLEAFKRKCRAKDYKYADWDDAFMEAIRENWAKLDATQRSPPSKPRVLREIKPEEIMDRQRRRDEAEIARMEGLL